MTTQEEINRLNEKIKREKFNKEFQKFEKEKELEKKRLKKEYLELKYSKPISAGKNVISGFKKIGKGFMFGINEIQKFNSTQEKRRKR